MIGGAPKTAFASRPATRAGGLDGRAIRLAACLLAGCLLAWSTPQPARAQSAPPVLDPERITDVDGAQKALEAIALRREALAREWREREAACRRSVLSNACQADLVAERRAQEARLRTVEIRAQAVIREDRALRANTLEAQREAERAARAEQARQDSAAGAEARAAREREREAKQAERARRDEEQAARAEELQRRRVEREQAAARRQEAAERSAREAPARAAEQAARVRQHAEQQRARRERAQERAQERSQAGRAGDQRQGTPPPAAPPLAR